jgi:iron(III) transport system ATP-binding protein
MMSVRIGIKNAKKRYGSSTIIPDLSIEIQEGEFFTLLGPSGCGKTTLLRMIAGFNTIDGGEFYFGSKLINAMDPAKRNIGMVFQNYAIFPHLTVRQNVEFGLKNRDCPREEAAAETNRFLKLMQIEEYADRLPERLSGGQQQRVALARALVVKPDVLLMDEPLSNLDAKLRVEMRKVIRDLQESLKITTVYVTHDQEEAMAISDRVAVMKAGVIQQVGTPRQLYQRPSNLFVATFIGRTNVLDAEVRSSGDKAILSFPCGFKAEVLGIAGAGADHGKVRASVRPEEFVIMENGGEGIPAVVEESVFLGLTTHYFVRLESGEEVQIIRESTVDENIRRGVKVRLGLKLEKINIFSLDGDTNLSMQGISSPSAHAPSGSAQ